MAKGVVFPFLTTAFVILTITSRITNNSNPKVGGLNRRLRYTYRDSTSNPLIITIQDTIKENDGLVSESGTPTGYEEKNRNIMVDHENEGKLDITSRLMSLFPLLDSAPIDGKVSLEELHMWNEEQAMERLEYRADKKMELHDKDNDGKLSFSELLPQFSNEDIGSLSMKPGEAGWWMVQFKNADTDYDGLLDSDELNQFLHPEDSSNIQIQTWVLRDKIRAMDEDGDGELNFGEFESHIYGVYKIYAAFEGIRSNDLPTAEEMFKKLDSNNDRLLEVKELLPIIGYIKPGELSYAKHHAIYLIQQADDNKDGNLSLEEIINHGSSFYTIIYDHDYDDMDEDDDFHDEL